MSSDLAAPSSELPSAMGRYRIVGRLASGGMAEILLGAADGAAGFTRPVVIKRVLPHLAREVEFRRMFVDEARILSTLRHPNLVTVEELGEDGFVLYLVMEYLDGEGLDTVVRTERKRGARLPWSLAVRIVADACAGLHAAHEHRDIEGRPLEIVHRDVSPQNLFLTYDGSVKVIDFGIAKAAHRETKTETGTVKGKFAYMSPEQIEGTEVDRRTDVFALGVVLHELLTGRRLFHRANQLEIVRAICLVPYPRPRDVDGTIPEALDRAVMHALARDRDERPATTLAFRDELLDALRTLDEPPVTLAEWMQGRFEQERSEKSVLLRRVATEKTPPLGSIGRGAAPTDAVTVDVTVAEPTPQRPRARWLVGGVAITAIALASAFLATRATEAPAAPLSVAPLPSPVAAAAPSPPAPPPAPPPPPAPATVHLVIHSTPEGAIAELGGRALGATPIDTEVPRSDAPVALRLSAPGYDTLDQELELSESQRLVLTLARHRASRVEPRDRRAPPSEAPSPFARVQ